MLSGYMPMSEDNKVSKAQQKAVNKYVKNNYDRINVTFPKGQKDTLKEHAKKQNESVNAFIVRSVSETIQRDIGAAPSDANPMLPPDTLKVAESAAETSGETVPQYIKRAVSAQSERDKASFHIGLNPVTGEMILNNANSK